MAGFRSFRLKSQASRLGSAGFWCWLLVAGISTSVWAQGDFQKGFSYYKQGQYEKAIPELEAVIKANPDYEDGYRILGDCYLKTKQYGQSAKAFQQAIRLKNDLFASYYGLALAYYNSGGYQDCIDTLLKGEQYARSPRERYGIYRTRGLAYLKEKRFSLARSDLEKANTLQRGDLTTILSLGLAHFHLGNRAQAEECLKQVVSRSPQNSVARRYLGQIRYRRGVELLKAKDYRQASLFFQEYLKNHPQDGDAWFNMGLVHLFLDDFGAAKDAFVKSDSLRPGRADTYNRLGYLSEMTGDYPAALQYYQKALAVDPRPGIRKSVERVQERIRRKKG